MKKKTKPDFILSISALLMILLGIIAIASASIPVATKKISDPLFYIKKHFFLGIIPGILLGIIFYKISLKSLRKKSLWFFIFTLILTAATLIPHIGITIGGARRWINFVFFSFQPSEILKLGFLVYLSAWLATLPQKISIKKSFFPFLAIISAPSILLILQPDISTLGVIIVMAAVIYLYSGAPPKNLIILALIVIVALAILIKIAPYRLNRWLIFLNPEADPLGRGYQIKQSLIAVGSGGIVGKGLGLSDQKYGYLPHPFSDSIFAVIAEETGFLGSLCVIALFFIFAVRGLMISQRYNTKNVDDKFKSLLAIGIVTWITFQAIVHIGANIGILPLTGIPLPFISYGNSALIAEFIALSILLNISKHKS
ncbi:cell division protein FtsW [bacterium]|nr:cell division protein FtsW [bacterium]